MIKDKNYVTNTALDCFSSCLLNYFEYNGIRWSPEEAYIIGGGMNGLFDKNKQLSIKPDISVTEIYLNALKEMKVPFRFATCDQNQNPQKTGYKHAQIRYQPVIMATFELF